MSIASLKSVAFKPTVTVRRHPFDSLEARYLISLLEADLAAFYPDWDELAHPGMLHENNPRPPSEVKSRQRQEDDAHRDAVLLQTGSSQGNEGDDESESSGLFFFVAFVTEAFIASSLPTRRATEKAIGCGALRLLPSAGKLLPPELDPAFKYAEVKRMYIHPDYRGLGISKVILAEMERYARNVLKLDIVVLETGLRQKTAVGLYTGVGYIQRGMFGEYVGSDPASGGDFICMEKMLKC